MKPKRHIDFSTLPKDWRKLNPNLKVSWLYLWNKCDCSGIWEIDRDLFEFENGFSMDLDLLKKKLPSEIEMTGDLVLMKNFILVNYGQLKENYNPHKPVFRSLEKYKLKLKPSLNQASFKVDKPKSEKPTEIKLNIPSLDEFLDYARKNLNYEFESYKESIRLKYLAWKENGWRTNEKIPRPIKNWKTSLLNIIPHLKRKETAKPTFFKNE